MLSWGKKNKICAPEMKDFFFSTTKALAESYKDCQHTQKPSDSREQHTAALRELKIMSKSGSTAEKGQVQLREESISY